MYEAQASDANVRAVIYSADTLQDCIAGADGVLKANPELERPSIKRVKIVRVKLDSKWKHVS